WAVLLAQTVVARPLFTRQFLKRSALFGCGMFLPLAGVCLYAAWAGVFSRFWFWTVTYASTYVTGVSWQDGWNNLCAYLQKKFVIYAGFSGLIAIGLLAAFRNGGQRSQPGNPSLFVWAFFLFSCLGASIGLYFREHYFILLLPALSILTGRSLIRLQGALAGWRRVAIVAPSLLFAVVLGWTVFFQRRLFFQLPADVVLRAIYPDEPFPLTPAIGRFIRGHSAPNATVAVIGSEPEVYFYSHRHSATGYIYTYGLMEAQPYALKMQRQMISEIESNRPEYLLWVGYPDSWNVRPASHRGIFAWFGRYAERFYEPVGAANGGTGGLDAGKLVLYKRNHVGSQ
ncbi:MAG: hypothetical protein KGR98_06395, partial [Verrucomicrobia bacterium]|nr:hypothetical protein [Verrucomicrobiota bacterium]